MDVSYLKEISEEIDKRLDDLYRSAQSRLKEIDDRLVRYNEEYKIARADGDLRENASFEDAVKNIQGAQSDRQRWEILSDGIMNVRYKVKDYISQDKITILSTVHLKRVASFGGTPIADIEDEFIFKLFPYGITDIDNKILSIDSIIGSQLMDKKVGDVIIFRDKASGGRAGFEIIGFY